MRKILLYILIFITICFAIPILLTNKPKKEVVSEIKEQSMQNNENTENIKEYDYKQYNNIKLLHTSIDTIEEIPIDEYLYGVVSAEMPASFEKEALKAQAIVARTYTIFKIENNNKKHGEAHICDESTCCQAWITKEERLSKWQESSREENWSKIVQAVDETKGKIIIYEGKPINAFFHSNSGGKTETTINVWGGSEYPYLQSVETAGEEQYTQYKSEVILSKKDFIEKIKKEHENVSVDFSKQDEIKILEYTESNRVKKIKIGNIELSGVELRTLIGLKSTNFNIEIQEENIKFNVLGYGHGVGMSQTGADSMAKQGNNYGEIIKHFYTGIEIVDI